MPRIKMFRQRPLVRSPGFRLTPLDAGREIAAPLIRTGRELMGLAEDAAKRRKRIEDAQYVTNSMAQLRQTTLEDSEKSRLEAEPGAPDHATNFMKRFDENLAGFMDGAPSAEAATAFQQRANVFRATTSGQEAAFESKSRGQKVIDDFSASQDIVANTLMRNPDALSEAMAQSRMDIKQYSGLLPKAALAELQKGSDATLVYAAALGMLEQDPNILKAKLDKGEFDKYLEPSKVAKLRNQVQTKLEKVDIVAKARLENTAADNIAAAAETGDETTPLSREHFRSVFKTADKAQVAWEDYERRIRAAKSLNTAIEELKFSPALLDEDAYQEFRGKYVGGENMANEAAIGRALDQARSAALTTLSRDPVSYLYNNDQEFREQYGDVIQQDAAGFAEYATEVTGRLNALGLPPRAMRIFTDSARTGLVQQMTSLEGEERDIFITTLKAKLSQSIDVDGQEVNLMEKAFAEFIEDEKLSPMYKTAMSYAGTGSYGMVQNALNLKEEELTRLITDRDVSRQEVEQNVRDKMEPYIRAIAAGTPNGERDRTILEMQNVLTRVTMAHMFHHPEMTQSEAGDAVVEELLTKYYDAGGQTYIVPRTVDVDPPSVHMHRQDATRQFELFDSSRILHPEAGDHFDIAPLSSHILGDSLTEEESVQEQMTRINNGDHAWVNDGDGGVVLMLRLNNGQLIPLQDKSGRDFSFSLKEPGGIEFPSRTKDVDETIRTQELFPGASSLPAFNAE